MNKWDALFLAALLGAIAYAASVYYPSQFSSLANDPVARAFLAIAAFLALAILMLDYFLRVFSKAAEKG